MKKILMIIVMLIIVMTTNSFAKGIDVPEDIRVGLFYSSSAKNSITLSSPGGIELGTMSTNGKFTYEDETNKNESITIKKGSTPGSVYIDGYGEIGSNTEYPYFKSIEKDGSSIIVVEGKKYRGNIEIRRLSGSDMTVINHLSMQEYLYGVVPREIGGNSPIEAVKAQAIVARTYAAKNYEKRLKLGFNVCPTVDDQAYGGYEWENKNSNRAVDDTYGEVVTYNGELIGGYYFSTSGGYTESSENVWSSAVDYLKAVPDTYEPNVEGNTTWEVTLTAQEVKDSLRKNNINVGDIVDLQVVKNTDAGRVLELKVIGTNGEETLTKSATRTYFGLKSQWYTINEDAPIVGKTNNKEPNKTAKEYDKEIVSNVKEDTKTEENVDNTWFLKYDEEPPKEELKMVAATRDYSNDGLNVKAISGEKVDSTPEQENKTEKEESKTEKVEIELKSEDENKSKTEDEKIEIDTTDKDTQNIIIKEKKPFLVSLIDVLLNTKSNFKNENNLKVTKQKYEGTSSRTVFVFRGRGWGHAVGMSQNGAKGMAEAGFSAEDIIKWYYSGVKIEG